MAGTSILSIPETQIKVRWREPYVTEGLNKKMAGVVPRGIYRGFHLAPGAGALQVLVGADPHWVDHVVLYETNTSAATRYSLRIEFTGGDFTLTLNNPAWAGFTVYLAVYAEYSTLGVTAANLRVYTEAEIAGAVERDELIILGTVAVPNVPVALVAADLAYNHRTYPWWNRSEGALPWHTVIKNSDFSSGPIAPVLQKGMIPFWSHAPDSSNADQVIGMSATDKLTGAQSLVLTVLNPVATLFNLEFSERISVESGSSLKWSFAYKPLQALAAGDLVLGMTFLSDDSPGFTFTIVSLHALDFSTLGTWVQVEGVLTVPAAVKYIQSVTVRSTVAVNFSVAGDALLIDHVQMWVESTGQGDSLEEDRRSQRLDASSLVFHGTGTRTLPNRPLFSAQTSFLGRTDLKLMRADENSDHSQQPDLTVVGSVKSGENLVLPAAGGSAFNAKNVLARYYGAFRDLGDGPSLMTAWYPPSSTDPSHREYAWPSEFGRFLTYNALFDAASYQCRCDEVGRAASAISQNAFNVGIFWHPATAGTWGPGDWSTLFNVNFVADETFVTHLRTGTPDNTQPAISISGPGDAIFPRYLRRFPFEVNTSGREYSWSTGLGLDAHHSVLYNASFDGTTFTPDATTQRAMSVEWGPARAFGLFGGLAVKWKDTPTGVSWTSGGWDRSLYLGVVPVTGGYRECLELPGDIATLASGFPAALSRLYNRNLVKAWFVCRTNGLGGITHVYGYNINGVVISGTGQLLVTLSSAFNSDLQVCVVASFSGGGHTQARVACPSVISNNEIRVACWSFEFGPLIFFWDANSNSLTVSGVVLGVSS